MKIYKYTPATRAKLTSLYLAFLMANIFAFDPHIHAIRHQEEPQLLTRAKKPRTEFTGQGVKVAVIDADFEEDHANHVSSIIRSFAKNAKQELIDMRKRSPLKGYRGSDAYLISALNSAIESKVDFINISLRISPDANNRRDEKISDDLRKAFHKARDANIGIIKSAGNDNEFIGVTPYTQSLSRLLDEMNGSMILAVAKEDSSMHKENLANFTPQVYGKLLYRTSKESNRAGLAHDYTVAAPGANILGQGANHRPVRMSGTSMAAPAVTGIASLLKEAFPTLSANEILTSIRRSARRSTLDEKTYLAAGKYGCGIADFQRALKEAEKTYNAKY